MSEGCLEVFRKMQPGYLESATVYKEGILRVNKGCFEVTKRVFSLAQYQSFECFMLKNNNISRGFN